MSITNTEYQEYSGQSVEVATPNGLHGIPVSSGGNYTDQDGQQWICDEVDLGNGVLIQRVGKKVFDGSSDELWSKADSDGYYVQLADAISGTMIYSDKYPYNPTAWVDGCVGIASTKNFWVADTSKASTLISWNAYLSQNPLTVIYPLAEPIETPLTDEEIKAYRALYSNHPFTTVLNNSNAGMMVKYATSEIGAVAAKQKEAVATLEDKAETFADHETGTWVPEVRTPNGELITLKNYCATYERIGNKVFIECHFILDGSATAYFILGIPFTIAVTGTSNVPITALYGTDNTRHKVDRGNADNPSDMLYLTEKELGVEFYISGFYTCV